MSDLKEGLSIILAARKSDEAFITVRLQAAIDVMSVEPYYEHMKILRAVFHVPEPAPEEGGSDGA